MNIIDYPGKSKDLLNMPLCSKHKPYYRNEIKVGQDHQLRQTHIMMACVWGLLHCPLTANHLEKRDWEC